MVKTVKLRGSGNTIPINDIEVLDSMMTSQGVVIKVGKELFSLDDTLITEFTRLKAKLRQKSSGPQTLRSKSGPIARTTKSQRNVLEDSDPDFQSID